ncbi:MAG TPA: hypothetical protein PKN28_02670 [Clostridiales bacterium]|nr:hypothetical protein [Clostridiales bacterium]
MIRVNEIKLPLSSLSEDLETAVAKTLRINKSDIKNLTVYKRSVDSRKKDDIHFVYSVDIETQLDEASLVTGFSESKVSIVKDFCYSPPSLYRNSKFRPVVVGFGPAGMFASLLLARFGLNPLVLERGDDVDTRSDKVSRFWKTGELDENTNVQFGEGGAGTFSDGKLTTGIKNPICREVLIQLVKYGAPAEILYEASPHIGTDKLKTVVKAIRKQIISLGGEIKFGCKMTDIIVANGFVHGVSFREKNKSKTDFETDTIILAIGHSSRDTYEMLYSMGLEIAQKAFSVGMRIEHPQEYINKCRYGGNYANPLLPPAEYKLSDHSLHARGAYTFCMCPGGIVVNASSEKGSVTVNGMSEYKRDAENANSALLVGIEPHSFPDSHALSGMYLQREIEKKAFEVSQSYSPPAHLLGDFLNGVPSKKLGGVTPSCPTGVVLSDLRLVLPKWVTDTVLSAVYSFDKKLPGFNLPDAVLTAPETRSSAPVRIVRDEFMNASGLLGLYPCGEGAGYAGGIVSAAVDGIKVAQSIISDERDRKNHAL